MFSENIRTLQPLVRVIYFQGSWSPIWKWKLLSCVQLLRPNGLYSPWNSPGQNTWVGSLSLLQGIFPTQGLNPGLLHCRWILYQLSHKGSPTVTYDSWLDPHRWFGVKKSFSFLFFLFFPKAYYIIFTLWNKMNHWKHHDFSLVSIK